MAKILSCDDSRTIRTVVSKYMKQVGCEIVEATNGQECLEVAKREKPDLILLDVTMPVMDGLQTLKALREDELLKSSAVVMLTAVASKELVVEILKLGVKDYILKPFDQKELYKKVNKILRLWEGDAPPHATATDDDERGADACKILVIDDKANVLQLVSDCLKDKHKVLTTTSGPEGITLALVEKPDIILLDLAMPEMDGFQVFQKLKANSKLADVRVVGMSIETQTDLHKRAKEMGFRRILIKPFTKKDLEDLLSAFARPVNPVTRTNDVCIVNVPDKKDPAARQFLQSLVGEINRSVEEMAEEGFSKLVINMGGVDDLEIDMVTRLLALVARAHQLKIRVKFVRPSERALGVLREFQETKQLGMIATLDDAIRSFSTD
ncbi:MAG: response regulator [Planctomycetes bacterium]|nr:response regulator [Planctomycetota bacterium]MBI3843010.1 response regulator [Planctomycetota bacterium]